MGVRQGGGGVWPAPQSPTSCAGRRRTCPAFPCPTGISASLLGTSDDRLVMGWWYQCCQLAQQAGDHPHLAGEPASQPSLHQACTLLGLWGPQEPLLLRFPGLYALQRTQAEGWLTPPAAELPKRKEVQAGGQSLVFVPSGRWCLQGHREDLAGVPRRESHLPGLLPGPPLQPGELLPGGECGPLWRSHGRWTMEQKNDLAPV